jgi:hypothetical protein
MPRRVAAPSARDELVGLKVIHGPRRAQPGTYDPWARVLQAVDPRFEFTDPPFRRSLPMTLALADSLTPPVPSQPAGLVSLSTAWPGKPRLSAYWLVAGWAAEFASTDAQH